MKVGKLCPDFAEVKIQLASAGENIYLANDDYVEKQLFLTENCHSPHIATVLPAVVVLGIPRRYYCEEFLVDVCVSNCEQIFILSKLKTSIRKDFFQSRCPDLGSLFKVVCCFSVQPNSFLSTRSTNDIRIL